eukprot:122171-Pelagomonas_calceolata.AAC.1
MRQNSHTLLLCAAVDESIKEHDPLVAEETIPGQGARAGKKGQGIVFSGLQRAGGYVRFLLPSLATTMGGMPTEHRQLVNQDVRLLHAVATVDVLPAEQHG